MQPDVPQQEGAGDPPQPKPQGPQRGQRHVQLHVQLRGGELRLQHLRRRVPDLGRDPEARRDPRGEVHVQNLQRDVQGPVQVRRP